MPNYKIKWDQSNPTGHYPVRSAATNHALAYCACRVRQALSKYGKVSIMPVRKKTTERVTAKKSRPRRAREKAESGAHDRLEGMSLDERITAVEVDVRSKRDEFRSIEGGDLANLLGIDDLDVPGGGWEFTWYVPHETIEDIFSRWDDEYILLLLQPHITSERYKQLQPKIELATRKRLRRGSLNFLTKLEKQTIERLNMEHEARGEPRVVANYTIEAPCGRELRFEVHIGDGGESCDLKTPYDERDGAFTDLSDCLIVQ